MKTNLHPLFALCSATLLLAVSVAVLLPATAAFAQGTWTQKADFGGTARHAAVGFSIGLKGYIGLGEDIGGDKNDFWEYDPGINVWTQKANFSGTAREQAVGFSIGAKGYVGTGWDGAYKNDFWEYDPGTNAWTQKANFGGTSRRWATAFSIGTMGYIGTGWDGAQKNDFWEYNPAADTIGGNPWTQKANFGGTARNVAVGFSIGAKGYIGTGDSGPFEQDFWEYNPAADTIGGNPWTQKANFGGTARNAAVGFSIGTKGYIGTGWDGTYKNDFWEYEPLSNSWTQKAIFSSTARYQAACFSISTKGYIGIGNDGVRKSDFYEFNPCGSLTSTLTKTDATCPECSTGSASVNVQGGVFPFIYQWSTGLIDTSVFNQYDLNNIPAGGYGVTVTDNSGCTTTAYIYVNQPTSLTTFVKTFGGTGDDPSFSVTQTTEGGYVFTGYATSFSGTQDVYLVKTDGAGTLQGSATYGDTALPIPQSIDAGHSVRQTTDGGYIIAGETNSYGSGGKDVYLLKTDSLGNPQWSVTYGDTLDEIGYDVQQTADGGYIITGETYSVSLGQNDIFLVRTNATGIKQWSKSYGSANYDEGRSVVENPDGGFTVAGQTRSYGAGSYDVYLLRTDVNGSLLWTKTFGEFYTDKADALVRTTDGGYIICGYMDSTGTASDDVYVIKTDSLGAKQWSRTIGGASAERAHSVYQCANGEYVITGYTYSYGAGGADAFLIRLSPSGALLWAQAIGGLLDDTGYDVKQTSDGGFIVSGLTLNNTAGSYDMLLIKTDQNFNTSCNGQGFSPNFSIPDDSVSSGGNVTIGGLQLSVPVDSNGASSTVDSTVCIFQCNILLAISKIDATCYNSNNGSATVTASNGTPPYTYFWSNGNSTSTINLLPSSIYSVTVSDLSGCTATASATIDVAKAGNWTKKSDFGGTARSSSVGFSIGTKGYIGTGTDDVTIYRDFWEWDQVTDAWSQKSDFGGTARLAAVGFSIGTKGYIGTGWDDTTSFRDFWEWDQSTNTWTPKADFGGTARYVAAGFSIPQSGKGYIGTGWDGTNKQDFWEYDTAANTWTPKADFGGTARRAAVGFSIGAKGYIGTGLDGATDYRDFWEWDQSTNTWTKKADFGGAARRQSVGFSIGAKGYIGTGWDAVTTYPDFWEWDQSANTWTKKADYSGTGLWSAAGLSIGAKGYIGTGANPVSKKDFWEFYADTNYTLSIGQTNLLCNGDSTGSVTANPAGGFPPYTYLWNTAATSASLSGLVAGNYSVTVTDANGCTSSNSTAIIEPPVGTTSTDTIAMILHDGINCIDYPIVKIGSQWWMKENLNNTRYADGAPLVNGTGAGSIAGDYTTKYFFNYNDTPAYSNTYGKLYTWAAAMNGAASSDSIPSGVQGVCPTGWHLPGDAEWKQLEMGLGMTQAAADGISWRGTDEGSKLKDNVGWNGTNTSGFSALPAGYRHFSDSTYWYLGSYAIFWSAADTGGAEAWSRSVDSGFDQISRNLYGKSYGFSVRCVKNILPPLTVSITNVTNVSCNGLADGSATAMPTGGTPPYSYQWSNLTGFQNLLGLSAGNYTVTVTDAGSNTATDSIAITEPPFVATYTDTVAKILFDERNCRQYPIVKIGNQWWMKENLDAGTMIVSDTAGQLQTDNGIIEKYCHDNISSNCNIYGGLYEWNEAMNYSLSENGNPGFTQGICPIGWRLPTDAEWCELENYVDSTTDAGCTLSGWRGTDIGIKLKDNGAWDGDNSSTFAAVPTSYRSDADGTYSSPGQYARFWASTEYSVDGGFYRGLNTGNAGCSRGNLDKKMGLSVRCMMDVPAALTVSITNVTNVTCNGLADGSATASPSGGTPPYSYQWSNLTGFQNLLGLSAGSYTVTVTDADSTTATDSVTITEPAALGITTFNPTFITCNGGSDGALNPNYIGGTPPYSYLWSNGDTTAAITNLSADTFTFTLTDANGCTFSDYMTLPDPPAIIDSALTAICSGDSIMLQGAFQTVAGTYYDTLVSVNGCDSVIATTLTVNPTYNTPVSAAICSGNSIFLQGAFQTSAGIYYDTLTSVNGCDSVIATTLTVYQPATVDAGSDQVLCGSNGYPVFLNATKGGSTDNVFWTTNGTGVFDNAALLNPVYTMNALDVANGNVMMFVTGTDTITGCTGKDTMIVTISSPPSPFAGNDGTECDLDHLLAAVPTVGTGTWTIVFGPGSAAFLNVNDPASTVTVSTYGTYIFRWTEVNSPCANSDDVSVNFYMQPNADAGIPDTICGLSYSLTAFPSVGIGQWIHVSGTGTSIFSNPNSSSSQVTVSSFGSYVFQWKEVNATCSDSDVVQIDFFFPLVNISYSVPKCYGSKDGSVTANVSGGSLPYTYLWSNGDTTVSSQQLSVGNYTITVTDVNGCTGTQTITLTEPVQITVTANATNVTTCGGSNGSITVTASGGSGTLQYSIDGGATFQSSNVFSGLIAGTYTIIVKDINNCAEQATATVNGFAGNIFLQSAIAPILCNGRNDGVVAVTPSGGTSPYTYLWANGASTDFLLDISAGTYNVTVTDAAACVVTWSATVTEPASISVTFGNITYPTCGFADGIATANISGGTPPYSYVWSSNDTLATANGLGAGIHSVIVTDNSGCIVYGTLSLSSSNGPLISFTKTDNNCSNEQNGIINLSVTGGNPPYFYEWSDGITIQNRTGLAAGIYEVVVTAADSCIASATIEITSPDELIVEVTKEDASCGIPDGSASLTVNGGTPPYAVTWSTGNTGTVVSGLSAGVYFVGVLDNNGCMVNRPVAINDIGGPDVSVISMSNVGCGSASTGTVNLGVTGGSGGYSFLWSDSSTSQNASGLSEGEYFVTVTDSAGCISVENIMVETVMPVSQPICIITVDSITGKNLIVWDKTVAAPDISEFKIYKEGTAAGVYNLLATVSSTAQSEYTDLAANPLQRSWRYKITAVDSCGNESEFSTIHKTMHLAVNLGLGNKINLIWDPYEGFNYGTFIIYRGTDPNQIDSLDALASTLHSYTDLNPPQTPKLYYVVEAVHPSGCTSQVKVKKYNASKSNTADQMVPVGISELQISDLKFQIVPNPNRGEFILECQMPDVKCQMSNVKLYNVFGQEVFSAIGGQSAMFSSGLSPGMYFIKVTADGERIGMGKMVVE